jgi:hypothetical protein
MAPQPMFPPSQQISFLDGTFVKAPKVSLPGNGVEVETGNFDSFVRFNTSTFGIAVSPGLFETVIADVDGIEGAPVP